MLLTAALHLRPIASAAAAPGADVSSFFGTSAQLWAVGLIFLRLASMIMLVPGLGDTSVPPMTRLGFALLLAMVITPIVSPYLPPMPPTIGFALGNVLHEVIIGLMLGTLMRVLLFTLVTTGELLSLQTTLSFAQTANPTEAQSSTSLGAFLAMFGLTLIWATGLHHVFIRAMVDSYQVFSPVKPVMIGDAVTLMIRTVEDSLVLALQLSAPIIVFALIFNIATGFVGRMMPAFPVFFAATPLSVLIGLALLGLSLGSMGMVFIDHYEDFLRLFLRPSHG